MRLSLVAALAHNRVIGRDNKLPWHLPEDLKHFRALTSGHPVIMGRKTFESIGRPLPGRLNIVISRNGELRIPGVTTVTSLDQALLECKGKPGNEEVFVIGGAQIYSEALPRADRLYLTILEQGVEGDALFPEWRESGFREVSRREGLTEPRHTYFVFERA